jgi:hypothetical protein
VMWCGSVKFPNGAVVGLTATLPADQKPESK